MDQWPMGNHVQLSQAKSLSERAETARRFVETTGLEVDSVFVDTVEDDFMHLLSAHPQRFFVVDATGTLHLKASPFEGAYSLDDVHHSLAKVCGCTEASC